MTTTLPAEELRLTEQDEGRVVSVLTGEEIVLELPENPKTGLRWTQPDAPGIALVDDTYAPAEDAMTGQSIRIMRLLIEEHGRLMIRLRLNQDWEPDAPPEATFEVEFQAV